MMKQTTNGMKKIKFSSFFRFFWEFRNFLVFLVYFTVYKFIRKWFFVFSFIIIMFCFFRFWDGKNQLYLVQKLFFLTILLATGIFFILESRDTIIQLSSSSLLIEEKFPSFSKDIIMLFTIIVRSFGLVR